MNFMKATIFVTAIFLLYFASVDGDKGKILKYFRDIIAKCLDTNDAIKAMFNQCNTDSTKPVVNLVKEVKNALAALDLTKNKECAETIIEKIDQVVQAMIGIDWSRDRSKRTGRPSIPEIWKSEKDSENNKSNCDYCKEIYAKAVASSNNATPVETLFEDQC